MKDQTTIPEEALSCMQGLRQLKVAYNKPIIAYSEWQLLGANYIIASSADAILVAPLALVGAIGYSRTALYCHGKDKKDGTVLNFIFSGKFKDSDRIHLIPKVENIHLRQALVNDYFNMFIKKIIFFLPRMEDSKQSWLEGNRLNSEEALEFGLIDKIADRIDLMVYVLGLIPNFNVALKDVVFNFKHILSDLSLSYKSNKEKHAIGIIEINGLGSTGWDYAQILLNMFKDESIDMIILYIRSGGGSTTTGSSIYNDIIKLKNLFKKSIITYTDEAQSAAYHIASATDYIIAGPGAIIGRIGVYFQKWDHTKKNDEAGLKFIASSSGKFYEIFNENEPLDEDGNKLLQKLVDFEHAYIIEDIKKSRPGLKQNVEEWAEAQVFIAEIALELGLIDAIGTPLDALNFKRQVANNKLHELDFVFKTLLPKAKNN